MSTTHARYGWFITTDYIAEADATPGTNRNAVGLTGPRNIAPGIEARLKAGEGDAFRMKDDDGELYYAGRVFGDYFGFEPLDDFGTPNAGATSIELRGKSGTWERV